MLKGQPFKWRDRSAIVAPKKPSLSKDLAKPYFLLIASLRGVRTEKKHRLCYKKSSRITGLEEKAGRNQTVKPSRRSETYRVDKAQKGGEGELTDQNGKKKKKKKTGQ